MIYYGFVVLATILFSLQFLFNQKYEKDCGTGIQSALLFSFYKSLVIIVVMTCVAGFRLQITTVFSLFFAVIYAVILVAMVYFSIRAFEAANLSVYSVFSMLGGMLLPFLR